MPMIKVDPQSKNLLLVSYPSGGYGFYMARLINFFVTNVIKTSDLFQFDETGTSHLLPLVAGDIHFEQNHNLRSIDQIYQSDIDQQKYIIIPYCPGINNDNPYKIEKDFPNSKIIRLYYQDNTWPLVFQNCIIKAANDTLEKKVKFESERFGSSDDWAQRENYTLLCQHHELREKWKPHANKHWLNIDIYDLITNPHGCLYKVAEFIDGNLEQIDLLDHKHQQFLNANPHTVQHLANLQIVNDLLKEKSLNHITELYQQAVINFYVKCKFDFWVPPNDYADWFTNTTQIVKMLNQHGIRLFDQNTI